jgi:hypothetical protein
MFVSRMHEVVRETTIIGEDDESCSLLVEATHREYSLRDIDHIHDPLLIISSRETCRHDITRLVIDVVDEIRLICDHLIINLDDIDDRIDDLTDMSDDIVDCDESLGDILFCLSTRANSGMSEVFLEFHNTRS